MHPIGDVPKLLCSGTSVRCTDREKENVLEIEPGGGTGKSKVFIVELGGGSRKSNSEKKVQETSNWGKKKLTSN